MGRVEGKVALITGAGRGMGASHARVLAREGADVILIDAPPTISTIDYKTSTKADLDRTVSEVEQHDRRAIAVEGDVRSQADLDKAVQQGMSELGKIDFLVANAGIWGQLAPITEMSEEQWHDTVDINLTGEWRAIKAVAPHMIERQAGIDRADLVDQWPRGPGALGQLLIVQARSDRADAERRTRARPAQHSLQRDLPRFIDTSIHHWQAAYDLLAGHPGGTLEDRNNAARFYGILRGRGPLDPAHVSNSVVFLLSDDAGEITGHELPVDSGHMVLPHFNPAPVDL